jgi:hypothetical protein
MPRLVVTADQREQREGVVIFDERVLGMHLRDGHAAAQLIERLGWAINDAEELEATAGGARER